MQIEAALILNGFHCDLKDKGERLAKDKDFQLCDMHGSILRVEGRAEETILLSPI